MTGPECAATPGESQCSDSLLRRLFDKARPNLVQLHDQFGVSSKEFSSCPVLVIGLYNMTDTLEDNIYIDILAPQAVVESEPVNETSIRVTMSHRMRNGIKRKARGRGMSANALIREVLDRELRGDGGA